MRFVVTSALTLALSPEERERPAHIFVCAIHRPASPVANFSKTRGERESPLLGERVWVRGVVKLNIFESP